MALDKTQQTTVTGYALYYGIPDDFGLGVIDKESAGRALYTINGEHLPAIRIEGHYFYKRLNEKDKRIAIESGLAAKKAGAVKNPNTMSARYAMLERMIAINKEAAYESISIGVGQVMGSHFKILGYQFASQMFEAAKEFDGQVRQMFAFIAYDPRLLKAAQNYKYKDFAKIYNGPAAKESYWTDLEDFVLSWRTRRGGEDSPIPAQRNWILRINALGFNTVMEFQQARSIKVDGIVGKITREQVELAESEVAKRKREPIEAAGRIGGAAIAVGSAVVATDNPQTVIDAVQYIEPVTNTIVQLAPLGTPIILGAVALVIAWAAYKGIKYWIRSRADVSPI